MNALSDWLEAFQDDVQKHPDEGDQSGEDEEEPDINAIQEQLVDNQVRSIQFFDPFLTCDPVICIFVEANLPVRSDAK